tara:strand:- start:790 stop:1899 length:1110 start_codon:yes stop_codon:yes gene_type:complete
MKILILSNGNGEDTIAINIINAFLKHKSDIEFITCPLVGNGKAYLNNNLNTLIQNPIFPSGGFIRSIKDLLGDIKAGLISHIRTQINAIKKTEDIDITIAVGDVFCLWLASFSKTPTFFLPTAKSDHFMPHSFFERWAIRKLTTHSFPRDIPTTNSFNQHNLPASFYGNPMMDSLITNQKAINNPTNAPVIGLLPGSREEAYQNLIHMLTICEAFFQKTSNPIFVCALPQTLTIQKIAQESKWTYNPTKKYLQSPKQGCIVHLTTHFKELINQANCIIGLAGTANEQALYLGKTVICFEGFGPQSSLKRFREQQKLMGDTLVISETKQPDYIIKILEKTLQKNPAKKNNSINLNASEKISEQILKTIKT